MVPAWKKALIPKESRRDRQHQNENQGETQPSHLESRAVRIVNRPVHFLRGVGAARGREGETEKKNEKDSRQTVETNSAPRFETNEATPKPLHLSKVYQVWCMPPTYEAEPKKKRLSFDIGLQ